MIGGNKVYAISGYKINVDVYAWKVIFQRLSLLSKGVLEIYMLYVILIISLSRLETRTKNQ